MNTKVEEALGVLDSIADDLNAFREAAHEARTTLAAHIAQLTTQLAERDATIARLKIALATIRDSTFRSADTLRNIADYTLNQENDRG